MPCFRKLLYVISKEPLACTNFNRTFSVVETDTDIRSIGMPFPTVRIVILDPLLCPTPLLVEGEIFLGGPQLFENYLGLDPTSQNVQIDHDQFGRLYRTGDLGYFDEAGQIMFSGRSDSQVKFRGQRVELSGLSMIIEQCPTVSRAVVLVVMNKLIAFVVWTGPNKNNTKDLTVDKLSASTDRRLLFLQTFLGTKVSVATNPQIWLELSYMPFTTSGKTDYRRLKLCAETLGHHRAENNVEPKSPLEQIIHDCCSTVLGYVSLSITANIIELGLDSFSAMALWSKLRNSIPWHTWTLHDLFSSSSLQALVPTYPPTPFELCPTAIRMPLVSTYASGMHRPVYPASSTQERFYSCQEIYKDATYSCPFVFELRDLDIGDIQRAVKAIIKRNSIFRTTFTYDNGVQQVISSTPNSTFTEHHLVQPDYTSNEAEMKRIIGDDLGTPFNLNKGPLIRCHGFRLDEGRQFISLNMHHIITDE